VAGPLNRKGVTTRESVCNFFFWLPVPDAVGVYYLHEHRGCHPCRGTHCCWLCFTYLIQKKTKNMNFGYVSPTSFPDKDLSQQSVAWSHYSFIPWLVYVKTLGRHMWVYLYMMDITILFLFLVFFGYCIFFIPLTFWFVYPNKNHLTTGVYPF
jgi:hypothetical protein